MRNYSLKWGVVTILFINCCPRLKHYPWNCAQPIVCLLSHNVITTCINLHLFCEIFFWTLIEIFCFYTMFITFVRWRLSVGSKMFTYLLTYDYTTDKTHEYATADKGTWGTVISDEEVRATVEWSGSLLSMNDKLDCVAVGPENDRLACDVGGPRRRRTQWTSTARKGRFANLSVWLGTHIEPPVDPVVTDRLRPCSQP